MADSEQLQGWLLVASESRPGSGVDHRYVRALLRAGDLFQEFDHKTVLSVATFVVIGGLLVAPRGNRCARPAGQPASCYFPFFAHFGLSGRKIRHGHSF